MTTSDPRQYHLDIFRSVVMEGRVLSLQAIIGQLVNGFDDRALHGINLLDDQDLAMVAVVGEKVSSMAAMVLGARREVGDEVGVVVIGNGPVRPS